MSAHSKLDLATGELLFFDYGDEAPYLSYGVADSSGKLLHEVGIELPGPRLPHDLGFTTNYTILHDLPFFHDPEVLRRHKLRVVSFHQELPIRFGLIFERFLNPERVSPPDIDMDFCQTRRPEVIQSVPLKSNITHLYNWGDHKSKEQGKGYKFSVSHITLHDKINSNTHNSG